MKTLPLFCLIFSVEMVTAEFLRTLLDCHNQMRARHGVPPMTLNPAVSNVARWWANILAGQNRFEHNPNTNYGENLYAGWGTNTPNPDQLARAACESWYNEIKLYNYKYPGFHPKTGHFTQMVWRSSTQLGGGYAYGPNGRYVVVANYNPAGNYRGQFGRNVPYPRY